MNRNLKYNELWNIIHCLDFTSSSFQLNILYNIFEELRKETNEKCSCYSDANNILNNLLHNNIDNFNYITNKKLFFKIFHNEVNLKLNKDIYDIHNNNI